MVRIHGQRATPDAREAQHSRRGFRTYAGQLFEPGTRFLDWHLAQKIQRVLVQRAALGLDRRKYLQQARSLLLGPGAGRKCGLNLFNWSRKYLRPIRKPLAQLAEGAGRIGVLGAMREQRGNQLGQRIERVEVGDRAAILLAQKLVDAQSFGLEIVWHGRLPGIHKGGRGKMLSQEIASAVPEISGFRASSSRSFLRRFGLGAATSRSSASRSGLIFYPASDGGFTWPPQVLASAPPQLDPAPAVQPKQCEPERMFCSSNSRGSSSQTKADSGRRNWSIWLKSQS